MGAKCCKTEHEEERIRRKFLEQSQTSTRILDRYASLNVRGGGGAPYSRPHSSISQHHQQQQQQQPILSSSPYQIRRTQSHSGLNSSSNKKSSSPFQDSPSTSNYEFRASSGILYPLKIKQVRSRPSAKSTSKEFEFFDDLDQFRPTTSSTTDHTGKFDEAELLRSSTQFQVHDDDHIEQEFQSILDQSHHHQQQQHQHPSTSNSSSDELFSERCVDSSSGALSLEKLQDSSLCSPLPPPRKGRKSFSSSGFFGSAELLGGGGGGGEARASSENVLLDSVSEEPVAIAPPPRRRKRAGSCASSLSGDGGGVISGGGGVVVPVKPPRKIIMTVSNKAPAFVREMSDLVVKVGTRARLLVELDAECSRDVQISWTHNDERVSVSSNASSSLQPQQQQQDTLQQQPRIHQTSEGRFHYLDITQVMLEDEGSWTCVAENMAGKASCTCHLTVTVPKSYRSPEFVEKLTALLTETGNVSLQCKVTGTPTPHLRWFKDGAEIKAGDLFALKNTSCLGVYTCEATNCLGSVTSSSQVYMNDTNTPGSPSSPNQFLQVTHPLQDTRVRVGERLELTVAFSKPIPPDQFTVTWYNKGQQVSLNERVVHRVETNVCSLVLNPVEMNDEGAWNVEVACGGSKVTSSCNVVLVVPRNYRKPKFLEDLKAILTEEGLVSFECKVCGFPTPVLHWYKDGYELKPGDVYQLSGANSLGRYSCIAHNVMGDAESSTELTLEDIQHQLSDDERKQLMAEGVESKRPPRFITGLKSQELRIGESCELTVEVNDVHATIQWFRDGNTVNHDGEHYLMRSDKGTHSVLVKELEFDDQGEWKCEIANEYGVSVSCAGVRVVVPTGYKKPKFLEGLRAVLSPEGTVNLECKVIGVPVPVLKWYKDGVELKAGDIHRIISGADGTCCLGTYTCVAKNCMGEVSSSAALLGFEDKLEKEPAPTLSQAQQRVNLTRDPSLSTIMEERTSQMLSVYETPPNVPKSIEEESNVSVSIDGKDVSISLYETPDLTEQDAKGIIEMFADQYSEYISEHNVLPMPSLRFYRETSRSGPIVMEAVLLDVTDDPFDTAKSASLGGVLREDPTEADYNDDELSESYGSPMELSASENLPERSRPSSLRDSKRRHSQEGGLSRKSSEKRRKEVAVTPQELEMFGEDAAANTTTSVYVSAESGKSSLKDEQQRLGGLEDFERMMELKFGEDRETFIGGSGTGGLESLDVEDIGAGYSAFGGIESAFGLVNEANEVLEGVRSLERASLGAGIAEQQQQQHIALKGFETGVFSNIEEFQRELESLKNAEEVRVFGGEKFVGIEMAEMVLEGADTISDVESLTAGVEKFEEEGEQIKLEQQQAQEAVVVEPPPRKKRDGSGDRKRDSVVEEVVPPPRKKQRDTSGERLQQKHEDSQVVEEEAQVIKVAVEHVKMTEDGEPEKPPPRKKRDGSGDRREQLQESVTTGVKGTDADALPQKPTRGNKKRDASGERLAAEKALEGQIQEVNIAGVKAVESDNETHVSKAEIEKMRIGNVAEEQQMAAKQQKINTMEKQQTVANDADKVMAAETMCLETNIKSGLPKSMSEENEKKTKQDDEQIKIEERELEEHRGKRPEESRKEEENTSENKKHPEGMKEKDDKKAMKIEQESKRNPEEELKQEAEKTKAKKEEKQQAADKKKADEEQRKQEAEKKKAEEDVKIKQADKLEDEKKKKEEVEKKKLEEEKKRKQEDEQKKQQAEKIIAEEQKKQEDDARKKEAEEKTKQEEEKKKQETEKKIAEENKKQEEGEKRKQEEEEKKHKTDKKVAEEKKKLEEEKNKQEVEKKKLEEEKKKEEENKNKQNEQKKKQEDEKKISEEKKKEAEGKTKQDEEKKKKEAEEKTKLEVEKKKKQEEEKAKQEEEKTRKEAEVKKQQEEEKMKKAEEIAKQEEEKKKKEAEEKAKQEKEKNKKEDKEKAKQEEEKKKLEEEKKKDAENKVKQEEETKKKEADEKKKQEEEKKKEAEDKKKKEAEEEAKEEEEKKKKEAEAKAKKEEEKKKKEAEERAKKEEEKKKKEAEEKAKQEEEKMKKQEDEKKKKQAEEKAKQEDEKKKEVEDKKKQEAENKKKQEDEKKKKEAEEKKKQEEEKKKKEAEEKAKQEEEKKKKEAEEKAKQEEEKKKKETEEKKKKEEETKKKEAEEKAKQEEEKKKKEAEEKKKKEFEEKAKQEDEKKRKQEEEEKKKEAEEKKKQEEEKMKKEAEERTKKEEEKKKKAEEEKKQEEEKKKKEAEEKAKREEEKMKKEAEEKKKLDEEKKRKGAEEKKKQEEEKKKKEAEEKKKQEEEKKKKEAEEKAKKEEEKKKKEAEEKKKQEEEKKKKEAEEKAKQDEEKMKKEAEEKKKQEEEKKKKEAEEKKKQEEEKKKQEAEKKMTEERKKKEDEQMKQEEQKKKQEEEEIKRKQEEERKKGEDEHTVVENKNKTESGKKKADEEKEVVEKERKEREAKVALNEKQTTETAKDNISNSQDVKPVEDIQSKRKSSVKDAEANKISPQRTNSVEETQALDSKRPSLDGSFKMKSVKKVNKIELQSLKLSDEDSTPKTSQKDEPKSPKGDEQKSPKKDEPKSPKKDEPKSPSKVEPSKSPQQEEATSPKEPQSSQKSPQSPKEPELSPPPVSNGTKKKEEKDEPKEETKLKSPSKKEEAKTKDVKSSDEPKSPPPRKESKAKDEMKEEEKSNEQGPKPPKRTSSKESKSTKKEQKSSKDAAEEEQVLEPTKVLEEKKTFENQIESSKSNQVSISQSSITEASETKLKIQPEVSAETGSIKQATEEKTMKKKSRTEDNQHMTQETTTLLPQQVPQRSHSSANKEEYVSTSTVSHESYSSTKQRDGGGISYDRYEDIITTARPQQSVVADTYEPPSRRRYDDMPTQQKSSTLPRRTYSPDRLTTTSHMSRSDLLGLPSHLDRRSATPMRYSPARFASPTRALDFDGGGGGASWHMRRSHEYLPRLTERAKSYDHLPGYFSSYDTFSGESRGVACGALFATPSYTPLSPGLVGRTRGGVPTGDLSSSSLQSLPTKSNEDTVMLEQARSFSRELRQQQLRAIKSKWRVGGDEDSLAELDELPSSSLHDCGVSNKALRSSPVAPPRKRRNNYQVKMSGEAEDIIYGAGSKFSSGDHHQRFVPQYFTTPSSGQSYFSSSGSLSGSFLALDEAHRMKRPRFSMKLQDRVTPENTPVVKLACTVFGTPQPTIQWYKSGLPIFSDRQKYVITSECGVCTLDIHDLDRSDTGEYTCFARNFYGKTASTAILQVVGIDETNRVAKRVATEQGIITTIAAADKCVPVCFTTGIIDVNFPDVNELVLECQVKGNPRPDIMWMKNGQVIISYGQTTYGRFRADYSSVFETGKSRLIIQRPRESDSGVYTAVARNYDHSAVGRVCWTDEVTKCVNVKGCGNISPKGLFGTPLPPQSSTSFEYQAPKFITELEPFKRARIGEDVALTVEVTGVPQPEVRWFHHKNTIYPIKSSSHTRVINEAPGTHTLYIPSCDNFDFGTYTVRVTNKYGMVESSCSVCEYIVGVTDSPNLSGIRAGRKPVDTNVPPTFTREPKENVVLKLGDELVIQCEVEGWPQVAVNLYRGCRNVTLQHGAYKELNPAVVASPADCHQSVRFTLSSVGITDFGMYTVEAKNIAGVAKAFINVKPLESPHNMTSSTLSLRSTRSMTPLPRSSFGTGGVSPASSSSIAALTAHHQPSHKSYSTAMSYSSLHDLPPYLPQSRSISTRSLVGMRGSSRITSLRKLSCSSTSMLSRELFF